jgi:hypothetical protein
MLFIKKIVKKITLNVIFLKLKNHQNLNLGLIISKYSNKSNISLENNASIKYFYASGINYLYGHFEGGGGGGGGVRGVLCHGIKIESIRN